MDTYKYINYFLKSLILLIFPSIMDTQRITCPTPCDVGYTCAMVRHGRGSPTPGCITMQEAILLHQALSGGPSGPGTGIAQGGSGFPQQNVAQTFPPPMRPGDPIPGMNFLGGSVPPLQNFEQRFEQGIGRQQQPFVNPPGGMFGAQGGPMNPSIGSSPGTFGTNGQNFIDPTAGQFRPAIGFRPQMDGAIGFRPQMDGATGFRPQMDGALGFRPQMDACLNRNAWCPSGYVCKRVPREGSDLFEDRCVLPHQVAQTQRSPRLSARRPVSQNGRGVAILGGPSVGHGGIVRSRRPMTDHRGIERSRGPSVDHGVIDRTRRPTLDHRGIERPWGALISGMTFGSIVDPLSSLDNGSHRQSSSDSFMNPQISSESPDIPLINSDNQPWSNNVQHTPTETGQQGNTWTETRFEQEQISNDNVMPDLLKTNAVRRQSLPRNISFDRLSQTAGQIPTASSPFFDIDSMSDLNNSRGNLTAAKICQHRCNEHSDCNDLFTYCINKIPCSGKVCHRVT